MMLLQKLKIAVFLLLIGLGCSESKSNANNNNPDTSEETPQIDQEVSMFDADISDSETPISPDLGETYDASVPLDAEPVEPDPDPLTCEVACMELSACLISQCDGFTQAEEAQLIDGCLEQCTLQQAQLLSNQSCADNITLLSERQESIANACDSDVDVPPVSFQQFLLDWYVDYDQGQSTAYLEDEGTLEEGLSFSLDSDVVNFDKWSDVAYGPHGVRTMMDIYLPAGVNSAPVVVFVHGGGFGSKDKSEINTDSRWLVAARYLKAGVAVASINYRFKRKVDCEVDSTACVTQVDPDWNCAGVANETGCRLDVIYRDGARAIQYLRYRSEEFNIDPDRIGAWGSSAGSQIVAWIGFVPDLAMPEHPDPVLRESTRLQVIGHRNSQVSGASFLWLNYVTFEQDGTSCDQVAVWEALAEVKGATGYNDSMQLAMVDVNDPERALHQHAQDLTRVVHFIDAMDSEDPPFITTSPVQDYSCEELTALGAAANATNATPEAINFFNGKMVHHPRMSEPLYERCVERGLSSCDIITAFEDSYTEIPVGTPNAGYRSDEDKLRQYMIENL